MRTIKISTQKNLFPLYFKLHVNKPISVIRVYLSKTDTNPNDNNNAYSFNIQSYDINKWRKCQFSNAYGVKECYMAIEVLQNLNVKVQIRFEKYFDRMKASYIEKYFKKYGMEKFYSKAVKLYED